MYIKYVLTFALVVLSLKVNSQFSHPHILVNEGDKKEVLLKIEKHLWAKSIFEEQINQVESYVDRHQTDPEWILSRYLMNRIPGKRYTDAYDDGSGHYLVGYSGDAPVPTVRYSTHKRSPVTKNGKPYIKPTIIELVPYDTSMRIWAMNPETNQKELIDPQSFVTSINGDINGLAFSAAVIYWLNGDEKYAKFAADILDQWVKGAYYQNPITGACRTGFLDIQTLGDNGYQDLILAYDFVYPYMKVKGYDLSYYQTVFEKFASTLTTRGFWNNNWYAAVTSTLVYAVLSLEDPQKREYYLQYVLEKDTINGSCGRLGMPSTVKNWLTHDGHWKEPGGYHNFPVSNLVEAALALEKNGYNVFQKFPELFGATYAMLKYSFPNLRVSAFGDTGRASQSPQTLEIGLLVASKYNRPELSGMMSAMNTLIDGGMYKRENSGLFGLLTYLSELPKIEASPYQWPRSGELEFARFYLQRNGTDPKYGLMYGVQGASYNHNHCNGMAMEMYGLGEVMGIDAGTGPNYEHPLHVNYFSQWAAHNTVVAAGSSSSVPPSGGAGRKDIGQVELAAMEPMPDKTAVSSMFSFTDTRYLDKSTNTNQLRTMAIVRTTDTTGYYVDIYRSDNPISNAYVYHNIGESLEFMDNKKQLLDPRDTKFPLVGKDYPGFRFFADVQKLENHKEHLTGLFPIETKHGEETFMQVLIPKDDNNTYYRAKSPATKTANHYNGKLLPALVIRKEKEAWSDPFIAVYEPFTKGNMVKSVEKVEDLCNADHTVLKIGNSNGTNQLIFQGNSSDKKLESDKVSFSGHFGVVSLRGEKLQRLYLGVGKKISYQDIALTALLKEVSVELTFIDNKTYSISGNGPIKIEITNIKSKKAEIKVNGSSIFANPVKTKKGIQLEIPAGENMIIHL